jgi:hypothetical protein
MLNRGDTAGYIVFGYLDLTCKFFFL